MAEVEKTEEEWRKHLTPAQFAVLRQAATEPAFTGEYWDCHEDGTYLCAACGAELFSSATKFESGTGWPSFYEPIAGQSVPVVSGTMRTVHDIATQFREARRALNLVTDRFLFPQRERWFPAPGGGG